MSMTHADKLREVRALVESMPCLCDAHGRCMRCHALAAMPDPEEVELLETKVAAFGSTLQFQEKQAGQFKQQRDDLAALLKEYLTGPVGLTKSTYEGWRQRAMTKVNETT